MHTVICQFHERFDSGRIYKVGEIYPRGGFTPPEGRASALALGEKGLMNNTGTVYLQKIPATEPKKKAPEKAKK